MAVYSRDTFDTPPSTPGELTGRTPTGTDAGTGWTLLGTSGGAPVYASEGAAYAVVGDVAFLYGLDRSGGYPTADYDVVGEFQFGASITSYIGFGIAIRATSGWGGYYFFWTTDLSYFGGDSEPGLVLAKESSTPGIEETIAIQPYAFSANTSFTLRLRAVGNNLQGLLNDTLVFNANDSAHSAAGRPGFRGYSGGSSNTTIRCNEIYAESQASEPITGSTAEGIEAGDSHTTDLEAAGTIAEGAKLGDTFSASLGGIPRTISEGVRLGDAHSVSQQAHVSGTEGARLGDAHSVAGSTFRVTGSEGVAAGDSHSSALGLQVFGALGDSLTDEYQASDTRGPPTVLNWLELLVHIRGMNFGPWGERDEPRRRGYEYNWARSGSTMTGVLADQLSGLAAQVAAGDVTHTFLMFTGNEWANPLHGLFAFEIYNGDGTLTSEGVPYSDIVDLMVGYAQTCMDAIGAALDTAGTGGGMVILTPMDFGAAPPAWAVFTDPVRRGYLSGVMVDILAGVQDYVEDRNLAAGYTRFAARQTDARLLTGAWPTEDGTYVQISGVAVDYTEEWEFDPEVYDPFLLLLAPTVAVSHPGTLMGGEMARAALDALNEITGVDVAPLTNAEILEAAGIPARETTEGIEAGDAHSAQLETSGSVAEGARLGDTHSVTQGSVGSTAEGIEAGDTHESALSLGAASEDGTALGDSHATDLAAIGTAEDGVSLGDTHSASLVAPVGVTEGVRTGDTHSVLTSGIPRSSTEGVEAGDSHTTDLNAHVAGAEGARLGDAHSVVVRYPVSVTEGVETGDTHSAPSGISGSQQDGAALGDAHGSALTALADTEEGARLGDAHSVSQEVVGSTAEGIEAGDAHSAQATLPVGTTEGAKLGDSWASTVGGIPRTISEGVKAGDAHETNAELGVSETEGARLGDAHSASLVAPVSVTEGVKAGDSFSPSAATERNVEEGVELGDVQEAIVELLGSLEDGAAFGDGYESTLSGVGRAAEGINLGDSWSASVRYGVHTLEGVRTGDLVTGAGGIGTVPPITATIYLRPQFEAEARLTPEE